MSGWWKTSKGEGTATARRRQRSGLLGCVRKDDSFCLLSSCPAPLGMWVLCPKQVQTLWSDRV